MDTKLPVVVVQIFLGFIAMLTFIFAFSYFTFCEPNYTAAIGFIFSVFVAIIGVHLNVLIFRCQLKEWYDAPSQDSLQVFSVFSACVSSVVFGYSLTRAIVHHESLTPTSWYIPAIAYLICLVLSCWLYALTRWTKRFIELCYISATPLNRTIYRSYS